MPVNAAGKLTPAGSARRRFVRGAVALAATQFLPACSFVLRGGAFNGGRVSKTAENDYLFTADSASDPGLYIRPEELGLADVSLRDRQFLRFEIGGWISQEGSYGRLVVQVYDETSNYTVPAIENDLELAPDLRTVTIPLEGKIDRLQKIQFLLVTDRGSCEVQVRNIRFE